MTELLVKNAKIANSNTSEYLVYNFGLPAYQSAAGLKTCPAAGKCAVGCYAKQGAYVWTPVARAYEYRLAASLQSDFVSKMCDTIAVKLKSADRSKKQLVIRIHDSGDFYNLEYTKKWLKIISAFPNVHFYAYTKQVLLFNKLKKSGVIPDNFKLIYSEGGVFDKLINQRTDRHSRVFLSLAALKAAGYANAHENDLVAALGKSNKIGLVYHGHKSKTWTTSKTA